MNGNKVAILNSNTPINILLADDDIDDRHFFEKILGSIPINTRFNSVVDGEKLLTYLFKNLSKLPDILFLDMNMPRKNGLECLSEIMLSESLRHVPVIIYSTYLQEEIADQMYDKGAYYYVRKTDLTELKIFLVHILNRMVEKRFTRPERNKFILSPIDA